MTNTQGGFGQLLRQKRAELRLPLRVFARNAELDAGNVSKYERGLLPPPQDPQKLARMCAALDIRKGTEEYVHFIDLASAGAGKIPPDLAADPNIVARMPLLFRTARGKTLSREQLIELADKLKNL
jgi:transcriptional regulator with XRE-family HTH domain